MIFLKPHVMALAAFLFTTSASALRFDNVDRDRNGYDCKKFSGLSIKNMPQECVYHNFCNEGLDKTTCTYNKSQDFHDMEALAALKPYCISEIICDPKFEEGHNPQADYAKQNQDPDFICQSAYGKLDQAPKECAYEQAFKLARSNPYFDESYHDKNGSSCDEFVHLIKAVSDKCLLNYVDDMDRRKSPPTQVEYAFRNDIKCSLLTSRVQANPKCAFEYVAQNRGVKAVYADEYRSDVSCDADFKAYDEAPDCAYEFIGYYDNLHPVPSRDESETLAKAKTQEEKQEDKESDKAKNDEDDDEEDEDC